MTANFLQAVAIAGMLVCSVAAFGADEAAPVPRPEVKEGDLWVYQFTNLVASAPKPASSVLMTNAPRDTGDVRTSVEVAVSTLQKDRSKAAIYAAAGVREYWLIEPERKCLTVYRLPGVKGYREAVTYNEESLVVSSVLPGFSMSLPDLFRSTV